MASPGLDPRVPKTQQPPPLSAPRTICLSLLFISYSLSAKHLQHCLSWPCCVPSWRINSPGELSNERVGCHCSAEADSPRYGYSFFRILFVGVVDLAVGHALKVITTWSTRSLEGKEYPEKRGA